MTLDGTKSNLQTQKMQHVADWIWFYHVYIYIYIFLSKLQRRHTTSLEIWPKYRIKLVMCKWTMRVLICADSMFFHCQCSSPLPASFFLPLRCKDPQCRRLPFLGTARLLGARPHIFIKSPRPCLIPYLEMNFEPRPVKYSNLTRFPYIILSHHIVFG